ncbi:hypothetical protein AgCh_004126 [Apium graveolens]
MKIVVESVAVDMLRTMGANVLLKPMKGTSNQEITSQMAFWSDAVVPSLFARYNPIKGSAYEWVVMKKSGCSSEGDLISLIDKKPEQKPLRGNSFLDLDEIREDIEKEIKKEQIASKKVKHNRMYTKELALAFLLLTASTRSLLSTQGIHFYFLLFQGVSFIMVGLDLIGEQVS